MGGEKKRHEMLKPKTAILDEMDSGLDADTPHIVPEGIKRVCESGEVGTLLITHHTRILRCATSIPTSSTSSPPVGSSSPAASSSSTSSMPRATPNANQPDARTEVLCFSRLLAVSGTAAVPGCCVVQPDARRWRAKVCATATSKTDECLRRGQATRAGARQQSPARVGERRREKVPGHVANARRRPGPSLRSHVVRGILGVPSAAGRGQVVSPAAHLTPR